MNQERDDPIRMLFDNVLFETALELGQGMDGATKAVRSFAANHGVADTDKMAVSRTASESGLVRLSCPGYRIPIEAVYKDPSCQILDVLDEDDSKKLIRLAAKEDDPDESGSDESGSGEQPAQTDEPTPTNQPTEEAPPTSPSPTANPSDTTDPPPPSSSAATAPLSLNLGSAGMAGQDFTLDFWVFPTEAGTQAPTPLPGLFCGVSQGKSFLSVGGRILVGDTSLADNQWHHLCWRHNSGDDELLAFVNGQPDALASPWSASSGPSPKQPLNVGILDHLAVVRSVRKGAEINQRSQSQPPPPPGVNVPPSTKAPDSGSQATNSSQQPASNPTAASQSPATQTSGAQDPGTTSDASVNDAPAEDDGDPPPAPDTASDPADADPSAQSPASSTNPEESNDSHGSPTSTADTDGEQGLPPSSDSSDSSDEPSPTPAEDDNSNEPSSTQAEDDSSDEPSPTPTEDDSSDPSDTTDKVLIGPDILVASLPQDPWTSTTTATGSLAGTTFDLEGTENGLTLKEPVSADIPAKLLGVLNETLTFSIESLTIEGDSQQTTVTASVTLGLPASTLNDIIPGDWCQVKETLPFNLTIDSTGTVVFELLDVPLELSIAGCSFTSVKDDPNPLQLDLGDYGAYHFTAPKFTYAAGSFQAEGSIDVVSAPAFSTQPIKDALNHLKLTGLANALPPSLPTEPATPPDGNGPQAQAEYAQMTAPTKVNYSIQYVGGAGFSCDFFMPDGNPVKLYGTQGDASVGLDLYGLGLGAITNQFNLTIDAISHLFVDPSAAPTPSKTPVSLSDTQCRLDMREMVIMFTGGGSAYVPIPMFFETLALQRSGLEGITLNASASLPMPALPDAADLVKKITPFLTDPSAEIADGTLAGCPLSFSLENLTMAMPDPAPDFGESGALLSLGAEEVEPVLNALKNPSLDAFLALLPDGSKAGAHALSLFFLNGETPWALAAPDSFTSALESPLDFLTQAASWHLPEPLDELATSLFGEANPTQAAGAATEAAGAAAESAGAAAEATTGAASEAVSNPEPPSTPEVEVPDDVLDSPGF